MFIQNSVESVLRYLKLSYKTAKLLAIYTTDDLRDKVGCFPVSSIDRYKISNRAHIKWKCISFN